MAVLPSLSRLRERGGERVLPQWDNPDEARALTRRYAPTSPASGRGYTKS
jgi:vacuolar-type H+-ATPase subunit B/Vma2